MQLFNFFMQFVEMSLALAKQDAKVVNKTLFRTDSVLFLIFLFNQDNIPSF